MPGFSRDLAVADPWEDSLARSRARREGAVGALDATFAYTPAGLGDPIRPDGSTRPARLFGHADRARRRTGRRSSRCEWHARLHTVAHARADDHDDPLHHA